MKDVLFIINPTAGRGKAKALEEIIEKELQGKDINYSILLTNSPNQATDIAFKSKVHTIIAVGGDGTVAEVAKGIMKRGYGTLGVVPGGTGNDFIKSLNMSKDPLEAIGLILKGKSLDIDIGLANGHKFLNIGSIGLDAEVVSTSHSIKKKIGGRLAYIVAIFLTLMKFKKKQVTIIIDGKSERVSLVLFAMGNGRFYGGGLQMIPQAQMADGILHGCIVKDLSNLRIVSVFPEIFKGTHIRHKQYVKTFTAKKVEIEADEDILMNLDGELLPPVRKVEFSLSDKKLNVLVP